MKMQLFNVNYAVARVSTAPSSNLILVIPSLNLHLVQTTNAQSNTPLTETDRCPGENGKHCYVMSGQKRTTENVVVESLVCPFRS